MSIIQLSEYEELGYDSKEELLDEIADELRIDMMRDMSEPLYSKERFIWTDERYANYWPSLWAS